MSDQENSRNISRELGEAVNNLDEAIRRVHALQTEACADDNIIACGVNNWVVAFEDKSFIRDGEDDFAVAPSVGIMHPEGQANYLNAGLLAYAASVVTGIVSAEISSAFYDEGDEDY